MAYDFETRHDYLRSRMRAVNKRTVTWSRGGTSGPLSATVYKMDPEELQPFGVALDVHHVYFIVDVADLGSLLGAGAVPERNDEVTDPKLGLVFRIVPLGDEPPFRYTNHQRLAVRAHAIEVGEAEGSSSSSSGSG